MVNYQKGYIYSVQHKETGKIIYIGSSANSQRKRWGEHVNKFKIYKKNPDAYKGTSFVRQIDDIQNYKLVWMKDFPCNSRKELEKEEGEVQREYWKDGIMNVNVAGFGGICIHKQRKDHCKECEGSQICIHKREKARCKECEGSQICIHKRIKSICKECGGSSICIHKRMKAQCKECDGSAICNHKRQKAKCKECDGIMVQKVKCDCGRAVRKDGLLEHKKSLIHEKIMKELQT